MRSAIETSLPEVPSGRSAMVTDCIQKPDPISENNVKSQSEPKALSKVLHRSLHEAPREIAYARDSYVTFTNGITIMDTTCGAAVACIGYGNERVKKAMMDQMDKFAYCNSFFYSSRVCEELAEELIRGTNGDMGKAYIVNSGSEAMEAAMKMARQYFMEQSPKQTRRTKFIARKSSYHGTTLGALAVGGHAARRSIYEDMLMTNCEKVSPCYAYRGMKTGQSEEDYVKELATELDHKFLEMGPDTVCAFVAEPMVGATLGCVPAVKGYFKAMKEVCDKYGALLILDEVMSGMGRSGTLHAWQQEDVVPDLQTIGKGLGGGYAPVAGLLIGHRVVDRLTKGTGVFAHGHTYQGHPVCCAASLEVQRIIREEKLVENVRETGDYLGQLLHEYLDDHPHVGNVRGKGLFWGIELVRDKATKQPFPRSANVSFGIEQMGMLSEYAISLYPGNGSMDGTLGDHVLLAPAYNLTNKDMEKIAGTTKRIITDFFEGLQMNGHS